MSDSSDRLIVLRLGPMSRAMCLWSNGVFVQAALCGSTFFPRPPRERPRNALTGYCRCRDRRWLILTILNEERQWPVLARSLGREDLLDDARFTWQAQRFANAAALIAALDAAFATRDRAEWQRALTEAAIVFESVASAEDVALDRQAMANGFLRPFDGDTMLTVDSPLYVGDAPKVSPGKAPALGRHSDEILREAGYGTGEIERQRAGGVVQ